ncbi:MAG: LamG-like jellyroll fold domain-containing protein, partial [Verrucomicrobiota bacterium]|nr:LamG-like jellyroll fold domain-containing protein [Verrucomicrobiota bacterium]
NSHINGTLYLERVGDELHLEALVRKGSVTFAVADLTCTNALAVGQWYHAMLKVIDQGDDGAATDRVELYLDGELVDLVDLVDLEFFTGGNIMHVGHSQSTGSRTFDGMLDGVRLVAGTDALSLLEEIPNARAVLGLSGSSLIADDHILVLPDRNDTSPVYWMHTDGTSQEMRTVPVLR